jgi:hypothetical protein
MKNGEFKIIVVQGKLFVVMESFDWLVWDKLLKQGYFL